MNIHGTTAESYHDGGRIDDGGVRDRRSRDDGNTGARLKALAAGLGVTGVAGAGGAVTGASLSSLTANEVTEIESWDDLAAIGDDLRGPRTGRRPD